MMLVRALHSWVIVLAIMAFIIGCGGAVPGPGRSPGGGSTSPPTSGGLGAPVRSGMTLTVSHGYNDPLPGAPCEAGKAPDHCGNQRYGLDLEPDDQSVREILAPTDGVVALHVSGPGCILLKLDSNLNMNICHFEEPFEVSEGTKVKRGDILGKRSSKDIYKHIHLSLDARYDETGKQKPSKSDWLPVPFIGANRIEGEEFAVKGEQDKNYHTGRKIVSTNRERPREATPTPIVSAPSPIPTAQVAPPVPPTVGCGINLSYSSTVQCNSLGTGEIHRFTFMGSAEDKTIIRVNSSDFPPRIRIHRPGGTQSCGDSNSRPGFMEVRCSLDQNGTYSITVDSYDTQGRGAYNMLLQRTNSPGNAAAFMYGQRTSHKASLPQEIHAYTFMARAGDNTIFRMNSDEFSPRLRVYRPNGDQLCGDSNSRPGPLELKCSIDQNGTYAILVDSSASAETGMYNLLMQRTNSPTGATPLAYGGIVSANLAFAQEIDAFTFSATAGDQIVTRMDSGDMAPRLRVYRPSGEQLCGDSSSRAGSIEVRCTIDQNGTYAILVDSSDSTGTGGYNILLQRAGGR